jgi:hypothetical protein
VWSVKVWRDHRFQQAFVARVPELVEALRRLEFGIPLRVRDRLRDDEIVDPHLGGGGLR